MKYFIASLVLALLVGSACVSKLHRSENVTAARNPAMAREYANNFLPNATLTCDEFFKFLNRLNPAPQTIDRVLEKLSAYRPNYLRHHSLVYLSRSLHGSSFENPRALLYGSSAKMVMTFNGSEAQANFERMELMCFNELQKSFEFREITFPKEARDPNQLDDLSPEERKKDFVISAINGSPNRRCTACHHEPARPNWFTYPFWPGVYGSQDDYPQSYTLALQFNNTDKQERFFKDINNIEYNHWVDFHKTRPQKNRYRWIGGYNEAQSNTPDFKDEPNFHLNILLQDLNHLRVTAQLMRKIKSLFPQRYKIAKALYCADEFIFTKKLTTRAGEVGEISLIKKPFSSDLQSVLSANIEDLHSRMEIMKFVLGARNMSPLQGFNNREIQELVFNAQQEHYQFPMSKDLIETGEMINPSEMVVVSQLIPILSRHQIDIQNWAMKSEGDGYMFNDGNAYEDPAIVRLVDGEFMDKLMAKDLEILALIKARRDYKNSKKYTQPLCQKLSTL